MKTLTSVITHMRNVQQQRQQKRAKSANKQKAEMCVRAKSYISTWILLAQKYSVTGKNNILWLIDVLHLWLIEVVIDSFSYASSNVLFSGVLVSVCFRGRHDIAVPTIIKATLTKCFNYVWHNIQPEFLRCTRYRQVTMILAFSRLIEPLDLPS